MKSAIYIRVSTDRQDEENELNDCIKICKNRNWEYIIFREKRSGYKDVRRLQRDEIIELSRKGDIQHIVVWALDRWTRKGGIALLDELNLLSSYGVQLHSVQEEFIENFNMPGEIGIHLRNFVIGILGWQAKQESKLKSERILVSRKFNKAKDEKRVGKPDGFDERVEKQIKKIMKIKKEHPDWGCGKIAEDLKMSKATVFRRLKNIAENYEES